MQYQSVLEPLTGGLLVSCQAPEGDPFRNHDSIARFAKAAERGGAVGIRVNGPQDVEAVRGATRLPVLAIQKRVIDGRLRITPCFEDARLLVNAGARIIAIECTAGAHQFSALDLMRRVRAELRVPVMADIATLDEAVAAVEAGADLVASTMRGYTAETASIHGFEPSFIAQLANRLTVPVVAEGRVQTPGQAKEALAAGAFAVIVGGAITSPEAITARFAAALIEARRNQADVIGIDLGGTNTKAGVLSAAGLLECKSSVPTPATDRESLLQHVIDTTRQKRDEAHRAGYEIRAVGIATAGWVDPHAGRIAYATQNLPGWTDTHVASRLQEALNIPVAVENDANALAIAEHQFGLARGVDDFVCITLGTGIGGACFSGGRLIRGGHNLAGALGHFPIEPTGESCGCGLNGCLEHYANAAALVRYAGGQYDSAEAVIRAAHNRGDGSQEALHKYAAYLASGIAAIVQMLDPELVILSGGIAQDNDLLFSALTQLVPRRIMAPGIRSLRILPSELGYHGGVYGAGAVARARILGTK